MTPILTNEILRHRLLFLPPQDIGRRLKAARVTKVLSDMDDGGSFLDVINENELFGQVGQDDGNSGFNWADEFLSTTEGNDDAAESVQDENISPVEVVPPSIPNHIAVQQNVVHSQTYLPQGSTVQTQGTRSGSLGGMQIIQGATSLVQQTAAGQHQQINMAAMGQLQQGVGNQIVPGPNGQLILKSSGGGHIFLQTQAHPQLQSLQSSSAQASNLVPGSSQVINRIVAPNQSPATTSPLISRALTPATSPHLSRSLTPIQSWAGVNHATMVTSTVNQAQVISGVTPAPNVNLLQLANNAPAQQVLTRNIPLQFNTNTGLQLQAQSAVLQQNQGTILQQGQGQNAILQSTPGSNTLLQQGQGQAAVLQGQGQAALLQGQGQAAVLQGQGQAAVLQGQGQNIVNTQNTVIQNPNVVNLNVAHVLCNNPQMQNQTGSTVHHMAPNIQGTLIQTADGKNIIIPNNNVPQAVGGQSINIQNLPQMTLQPQLNIAQNTSTGSNMVQGVLGGTNLIGNIGNVIRLAQGGGSSQTPAQNQDKINQSQQPSNATHFIGVNQQGQQILIQRNPTGQQQNIILRTVNPNIVQLQQQQQQLQATGMATAPSSQLPGTSGSQQLLVSSQHQGIQLQRLVNTSQGQQVKLISQNSGQTPGMPLTINLGSAGIQNTPNTALPTIQVVPQQQITKTVSSSTTNQVGMILGSQAVTTASQNRFVTVKPAQNQSQQQFQPQSQQVHSSMSNSRPGSVQTLYPAASSTIAATSQHIDSTHTTESPHQLVQNLQNVQIPLSSNYPGSVLTTPNLSTASTTTVTTTVTQARIPVSQVTIGNQSNIPTVPSVQVKQVIADGGSIQKQNILQAKNSAPKLQHIQLTVDAQIKLHQVQTELKKLSEIKSLNNAQKIQRKNLQELQTKILSTGQILRPVVQTTTGNNSSPVTQHLIGQQTQQQVPVHTQNLIGQNVQLIGQNMQASQLLIGQPLPKIGENTVLKQEGIDAILGSTGSAQPQQFVQTAGTVPQGGNLVIKTEAPTISTLISSSQLSPSKLLSSTISVSHSTASLPQTSQIKTEPTEMSQDSNQAVSGDNTKMLINPVTTTAVAAPPGKVAISASPNVALPTPIKFGNHVLNLNLTPEQKEKVQGHLAKMTPEQQQQQISLFLKVQRKQQLQAQVNAQVKAQQNQQKQQTMGTASSNIPITVQKLELKPATASKGREPVSVSAPAASVTVPPARLSFASIPKSQLIHQQMSKDQDNALKPDTKTPFRSRRDTYRRLLRYHVFQCKTPPSDIMLKDHEVFKHVSVGLLQKKQRMFDKFRLLLLQESMREKKTAEMVMIQRLLNEDLKETIKTEEEQVKNDPDSFEPMPMKYLQKQESVKSEMSVDEQNVSEMSKVIKSENDNHDESGTVEIKKEQTSRPCTPKVRIVIRNDGQNFTSSLADDTSSDSNEDSYHDRSVDMELDEQNLHKVKEESVNLFHNSQLTDIKQEPVEENDAMESEQWSDSKPFQGYLESQTSPVSNQDLEVGMFGSSSMSPVENMSQSELDSQGNEDGGSAEDSSRLHGNTSPLESGEHVVSSDNEDSNVFGYHSSNEEHLDHNMFTEKGMYHSHGYSHSFGSADKQLFKQSFMSDTNVPFSTGNSLFDQTIGRNCETNQRNSVQEEDSEMESAVGGFPQDNVISQYEPISSPEADHDESFSGLITHKVDSAYTIGMGDQKDSELSPPEMLFNMPSFTSSHLDVKPRETVEDDEATTLYSDDSDKESDSQQELLKAQMESAINSIVSLNQDSSHHSPFCLDQSNDFFNRHSYTANPVTESESASQGPSTPIHSDTPNNDPIDVSMDDDLDAAVNSILM